MTRFIAMLFLVGCTAVQTPFVYTAACPSNDDNCDRNRTAETMDKLGRLDIALDMMCSDPKVKAATSKSGIPCGVY